MLIRRFSCDHEGFRETDRYLLFNDTMIETNDRNSKRNGLVAALLISKNSRVVLNIISNNPSYTA